MTANESRRRADRGFGCRREQSTYRTFDQQHDPAPIHSLFIHCATGVGLLEG